MKTRFHSTSFSLCLMLAFVPLKNALAQGFYFNVGGGYNFNTTPASNIDMCEGFTSVEYSQYYFPAEAPFGFTGSNVTETESSQSTAGFGNTYNASNNGFGKGFSFYASAGYSISKYFGAEIGFSYIAANTLESTFTYSNNNIGVVNDISVNNQSYSNIMTSSARYRLMPAVKFSIPLSRFTPYLKAGLVVGMGGKITLSNSFAENEYYIINGQITDQNSYLITTGLTASGGISVGGTASLGAEYAINNFLSVYAEVNIISENWSPVNGDITNYTETENGQNIPFVLTSNTFTYSNSLTSHGTSQTSPYDIQVYSQYPKQTLSFSSYGFHIGVKFSIPQKAAIIAPPPVQPAAK